MSTDITLAEVNAGIGPALALLAALENPKTKTAMLKELATELTKIQKERAGFADERAMYKQYMKEKAQFEKDLDALAAAQERLERERSNYRASLAEFADRKAESQRTAKEQTASLAARDDELGKRERSVARRMTQVGKREKAVEDRLAQLKAAGITMPDLPDAA